MTDPNHWSNWPTPTPSCEFPAAEADDPTPTTGGPVDYNFVDGCRCYIREDADWGEVLTRPAGGCPVHSCTCLSLDGKHSITCRTVALSQPHAMVCPDGDMLYPDDLEDAAMFASGHDAVPLNPGAFYALFPELREASRG